MRTFTVSTWVDIALNGDSKPSLSMLVVYDGRQRPKECSWTKVVEAEDWRKAYLIAQKLIEAGDAGDSRESVPVCPPKPRVEVQMNVRKVDKFGKKDAA